MIRVRIELVPLGIGQATSVWTAEIENVSFSRNKGDYVYRLFQRRNGTVPEPLERLWKSGKITGFPRRRLSAYDLLFRVLQDAVGKRNP